LPPLDTEFWFKRDFFFFLSVVPIDGDEAEDRGLSSCDPEGLPAGFLVAGAFLIAAPAFGFLSAAAGLNGFFGFTDSCWSNPISSTNTLFKFI
jgi:hypothetical protein